MANKGFFSHVLGPRMIESRIPKFFREINIQAPLPKIAMITVEGMLSSSWSVGVDNKDGCFFFTKKWMEFMKDNDIKYGHILHFTWRSGGNFHVKIHRESGIQVLDHGSSSESDDGGAADGGAEGGSWMESADRHATIVTGKDRPEHSRDPLANCEEDGAAGIEKPSARAFLGKQKKQMKFGTVLRQGYAAEGSSSEQREERRGRPTKVCEHSYAAAKKFSTKLGNPPNFIASLTKTCITVGNLHVPQKFIKEHMGTILGYRKRYATLCDSKSKKIVKVEIKRMWNKAEYFNKIASGFRAFAHGCGLKELDFCVFQALTEECDKFEVTVFNKGQKV